MPTVRSRFVLPTSGLPAPHFLVTQAAISWISCESVVSVLVDFEYYPAEQLGKAKDLLPLTLDGVTDIGLVDPSYVADRMPLGGVVELPGLFTNACAGTMAFWKVATGNGILAQQEYGPTGLRVLFAVTPAPYQVLTRVRLSTPEDLKGLKLRTSGGGMDAMVTSMGGVPVRITGPDTVQALSRGTIDGIVFPLSSVLLYQLQDQVKYLTVGENFGDIAVSFVISERKWRQLPVAVQEVLSTAGEETTRHACAAAQADDAPAAEAIQRAGARVVQFDAAQQTTLRNMIAPVASEWASSLDRRGKPGTEVLNAFRAAVAAEQ